MGGPDFTIDLSNDIVGPATVVTNGQVRWKPPQPPAPAPASTAAATTSTTSTATSSTSNGSSSASTATKETSRLLQQPVAQRASGHHTVHITKEVVQDSGHGARGHSSGEPDAPQRWWMFGLQVASIIVVFMLLGITTPPSFHPHLLSFVLACVIGYSVIWAVNPALHTPLMSVTNAISGIIIVGSMLELGSDSRWYDADVLISLSGIMFSTINIVGGFVVTHKMLAMFSK